MWEKACTNVWKTLDVQITIISSKMSLEAYTAVSGQPGQFFKLKQLFVTCYMLLLWFWVVFSSSATMHIKRDFTAPIVHILFYFYQNDIFLLRSDI